MLIWQHHSPVAKHLDRTRKQNNKQLWNSVTQIPRGDITKHEHGKRKRIDLFPDTELQLGRIAVQNFQPILYQAAAFSILQPDCIV